MSGHFKTQTNRKWWSEVKPAVSDHNLQKTLGRAPVGGAFSLALGKPLCIMIIITLQLQLQGKHQQHTEAMPRGSFILGSLLLPYQSALRAHSVSLPQTRQLYYNEIGGHQARWVIIRVVYSVPYSALCIHWWRYGAETYSLSTVDDGLRLVIMSAERCITVSTFCNK